MYAELCAIIEVWRYAACLNRDPNPLKLPSELGWDSEAHPHNLAKEAEETWCNRGGREVGMKWAAAVNEDTPLEVLLPLDEEDAFAKRSLLTNFWNLLGRPLEKHHFYFVRKNRDPNPLQIRSSSLVRDGTRTPVRLP